MEKITIFLASSNELRSEREQFEIEINRKNKVWLEKGSFIYLDIWEDLSTGLSKSGSQSEYNVKVRSSDIFLLLAYTKVGIYTTIEFEEAFENFKSTQKPLIFTFFKAPNGIITDPSLEEFQQKLKDLKHYYSTFNDSKDLWNQFNKELDRLVIDKSKNELALPVELAQNLETDENRWVQSLRQEFLEQGVPVGNKLAVFQHYGWLVETFLQKMSTPIGQERTSRRLSFMAEAFQSTLRYLSYIQLSQLLQNRDNPKNEFLSDLINLRDNEYQRFDYKNLLLITTDLLKRVQNFIPEINEFVSELRDNRTDLYGTALFLNEKRNQLLEFNTPKDENLNQLLDKYLTGLVFWLRKISFLAKYRLMSIKDINLNYRMGTQKNFIHLYGELHGMYNEAYNIGENDYNAFSIEDVFTFNKSVLLFKGSNIENSLKKIDDSTTYISLSPLVIDLSVFSEAKHTPEIFYYIGKDDSGRNYRFAEFKNEIALNDSNISSNKNLIVKAQNNTNPKLDELYKQLEYVFKPLDSQCK